MLTDPSKTRLNLPCPRQPTTIICASLDNSTSAGPAAEKYTSTARCGWTPWWVLSLAISTAAEMTFSPWVFRQSLVSEGGGIAPPPKANRPEGYSSMRWMRLSGTLRIPASRAAQRTAISDDGDPSTPTTIPRCAERLDIAGLSLLLAWFEGSLLLTLGAVTGVRQESLVPTLLAVGLFANG